MRVALRKLPILFLFNAFCLSLYVYICFYSESMVWELRKLHATTTDAILMQETCAIQLSSKHLCSFLNNKERMNHRE